MKNLIIIFTFLSSMCSYGQVQLEDFNEPIRKKEAKFDRVMTLINQTSFNINYMTADRELATSLISELNSYKEQLRKELDRTSNYKQAEIKLNELIDIFKNDFVLRTIKNNYQIFIDESNFRKNLVNEGKLDFTTYNSWKNAVISEYNKNSGCSCVRETQECISMEDILLRH